MVAQWNVEQFVAFVETFSATRLCIESEGDGFLNSASEKLKSVWGSGRLAVQLEFVLYVGRA